MCSGAPPVFLAALSGGADSTAMTAALASARDSGAVFSFSCLHINHNIRSAEECSADEKAVGALCGGLSVPFRICRLPPGAVTAFAVSRHCGLEAAARHFRRRALKREAERVRADAVLVAHTKDDLLETVLMAVLRGSGSAGLGAMRTDAKMPPGTIPVVRPLLGLGRAEVLAYLAERGLSWRNDPSNADTRFLRNRVRHMLVPLLDREFSWWREPLARLHTAQGMTADFLAAEARQRLPWRKEGEGLVLPAEDFFAQSPVLREQALFAALNVIDRTYCKRYKRAALAPFTNGETSACDLGTIRIENKKGLLSVKKTASGAFSGEMFSVLIKSPGSYKLGQLTVNAFAPGAGQSAAAPQARRFYAAFPALVRTLPGSPALEARDREGRAAVITLRGEIIRKRNNKQDARVPAAEQYACFTVEGRDFGLSE